MTVPAASDLVDVDVVVIGAGMAGLTAARSALEAGASVVVAEKSAAAGGSAAIAAGVFWAPRDVESLTARVPAGDHRLGERFIQAFPVAVQEVRELGVHVGDVSNQIMTIGFGYPIDISQLIGSLVADLKFRGGTIRFGSRARRLLTSASGAVRGVELQDESGTVRQVRARAVVIATGGFQGDSELRARYIGPEADSIFVRSHPGNVGDGFRMGCSVGAATSEGLSTFYGHLVPTPIREATPADFVRIALFFSAHSILLNRQGSRFCDETQGDEINNQEVLRQPGRRAIMLFDDDVHHEHGCGEPFPNAGRIDRLREAQRVGGRVDSSDTIHGLGAVVAEWGYDGDAALASVAAYNAAIDAPAPSGVQKLVDGVPVRQGAHQLRTPPFHAIEVQPAITFTYGGLKTTSDGALLDRDGMVVPGCFVAGADQGGLSNWAYAGGLAAAYTSGTWAGAAAAASVDEGSRGDEDVAEPRRG